MFKHIVFGLCGYECVAIHTNLPTLSELSRRHHWLAPVLVGGLSVHLYKLTKTSSLNSGVMGFTVIPAEYEVDERLNND